MAVDSQRDTFHINRVKPEEIGLLLSAQSYRPEITTAIKQIKKGRKWKPLQSICSEPITQAQSPVYAEKGHPCLKTRNILNLIASKDEVDYVTFESAKKLKRFTVKNQTILMNRSGAGSIGRASIYFGDDEPLTNEHLFRIVVAQPYDPAYVCAFLTSWWGERAIEQGISGSTGQLNLSNEHVRSLPVLVPNPEAQVYIGDKVRQAERLRERSKATELDIDTFFRLQDWSGEKPGTRRFYKANSIELHPRRLDASFYDPAYLHLQNVLNNLGAVPLSKIAQHIKQSWNRNSKYFYYLEIGNINLANGTISSSKLAGKEAPSRAQLLVQPWDIVVSTVRPNRKNVALVPEVELNLPIVASTGFSVLRFPTKEEAVFYHSWLRSDSATLQLMQWNAGGSYPAIDDTVAISTLVPQYPDAVVTAQGQRWILKFVAEQVSEQLTTAAKLLVEALIEGDLKESELKAAQENLRQRDNSLDRKILSQLTRKGYNVSGEPPLFPDLDSLYEVLKEAETSQEVE